MLLFLIVLTFIGCSSEPQNNTAAFERVGLNSNGSPLIQIVQNRRDTGSVKITRQLSRALRYTKIDYQITDLSILNPQLQIQPDVRTLVLTTALLTEADSALGRKLTRFVAQGNTLILAAPIQDRRLAFLQGLKPGAIPEIADTAKGISDATGMFPGFAGHTFNESSLSPHNGFKGSAFGEELDVLARAANDSTYPVILSNKVEKGKVVLLNTQRTQDKLYRGLMFSTLLLGLDGIPYSVVNGSTIFLDDFPAPLYDQMMAPVDEEYGVPHARFVANIWWPDMKKLADSLDMTYTAIPAFNYNANVVPPFDYREWETGRIERNNNLVKGSTWLAKDVARGPHELGFHGYNHFSFTDEEWPNSNFMISSLQSVRKRWITDGLGRLPISYVPPSNIIDSTGIQALVKGMSSIRYMSSLYLGDVRNGGGREYAPDPYNPRLFDFPRVTSGYVANSNSWFQQHSVYLLTGIWNHFIHPDDVFQIQQNQKIPYRKRNPLNLGWKSDETYQYGLYQEFVSWLDSTKTCYPFIRFEKARKLVPQVNQWRHRKVNYKRKDGILQVSVARDEEQQQSDSPTYYFMYVPEEMESRYQPVVNNQSTSVARTPLWNGQLYQFKTTRDTLLMPNVASGYLVTSASQNASVKSALGAYESYNKEAVALLGSQPGTTRQWSDMRLATALAALERNPSSLRAQNEVISLSVEFDRLPLAIDVLERRMLKDSVWQSEDQDRLVKYYGWQDSVQQGWRFTNRLWNTAPDTFALQMYDKMASAYAAPGDGGMAYTWLQRRLRAKPRQADSLRRSYAYRHQGLDYWDQTRPMLVELLKNNPASDTLYNYTFQRSLWYDSADSSLALLDSLNTIARDGRNRQAAVHDSLLMKFAAQYQGSDYWGQTRSVLTGLIERNPESDSLYHYTLQRSLWYDAPDSTAALLDSFPPHSYPQLQPLAGEIANLYAYQQQNLTKALWWARRTSEISHSTKLYWMSEQNRYAAYLSHIENEVPQSPPDSLQRQIINQLSYAEYSEPLVGWLANRYASKEELSDSVAVTFLARFNELNPEQREKLAWRHPGFFGDRMLNDITTASRMEQGEYLRVYGSYTRDNFDNTSYRAGTGMTWREDSLTFHEATLERIGLGSTINGVEYDDAMYQLLYRRHWYRPQSPWKVVVETGLGMTGGFAHGMAAVEAAYLRPKYTQARLAYGPIWTNAALANDYSQLTASVYREEPFGSSPFRLTGNFAGNYYLHDWQLSVSSGDDVFSYTQNATAPDTSLPGRNVMHWEATGRLYYELLEGKTYSLEPLLETTYADATRTIPSGVPYWTPDRLWIGGAGVSYKYNIQYLQFRQAGFQGHTMLKYDNQSGFYVTADLQANWLFHPYWSLGLSTHASSSATYRYNTVMLSLRYTFSDW